MFSNIADGLSHLVFKSNMSRCDFKVKLRQEERIHEFPF